ncbi:aldo/keto reductase [Staphylococcus agnetis]|uniref:aldo/keto reductase n=1 Tax=Staphylococcus agnetis TaxID=985762 RepID=UPI00268DA8AB
MLNQIELHPYFNQEAMFSYHEENQILIQAWSPIGRDNGLLKEPILQELAHKYTKSVVKIILRWHIQRGIMPIPKATSHARQLENLQIFDFNISDADMTLINQLSKIDGRRKGQDPSIYEEF